MKLNARAVLRFVLLFMLLFAGCLTLYPFAMQYYHPAALRVANEVMSHMDPPTRMQLNGRKGWRAIVIENGYPMRFTDWWMWQKHLHFLSLALVPALILATPAPWSARLRMLAIAMPILFVVHSLTIVGICRSQYCAIIDPYKFWCRWMRRAFNTSGQLFGTGLWVVLTWRYWVGKKPSTKDETSA